MAPLTSAMDFRFAKPLAKSYGVSLPQFGVSGIRSTELALKFLEFYTKHAPPQETAIQQIESVLGFQYPSTIFAWRFAIGMKLDTKPRPPKWSQSFLSTVYPAVFPVAAKVYYPESKILDHMMMNEFTLEFNGKAYRSTDANVQIIATREKQAGVACWTIEAISMHSSFGGKPVHFDFGEFEHLKQSVTNKSGDTLHDHIPCASEVLVTALDNLARNASDTENHPMLVVPVERMCLPNQMASVEVH